MPLLLYALWWVPTSPRGRLDQIRVGMAEADVQAILNQMEDVGQAWAWADRPRSAEVWEQTDEGVRYTRWGPPTKVYMLIRVEPRPPSFYLTRVTRSGIIYIDLDGEGRVCGKTWLEYPGLYRRFRTWLNW